MLHCNEIAAVGTGQRPHASTGAILVRGVVAVLALVGATHAVGSAPLKTVAVAEGVYALLGSGGEITAERGERIANIGFIIGPRGVIVVDSGASYREGEEIIAAVQSVTNRPIRLVILTHPDQDAVFGAAAFQTRGIPVLAHRRTAELIASRCETCLRNLKALLGDDAMSATRVVEPDRLIDSGETLQLIGRRVRLIAYRWSSAPGAIAVLDEKTSTLMAGSLVAIHRIPDVRDADLTGWRESLTDIAAMRCRRLVPGYGPIGSCADADAVRRYLTALERRVKTLLDEGVSLGELRERCGLPEFSRWDQYEMLHPENASRTYLRLERALFK